ncbi:MAG TPA: imidazole glycerol phosphate synthase subunit HisH [Candidatus Omnitrophota bacterium]|nr:imidazole glycerol phosphate synthase subunit HisH [Candidatus Omnitrophota bacterium]
MIAVIDYGMGNIHSVRKALESKGGRVRVTNSPSDIERADKLVLPGVGAFGDAMKELHRRRLDDAIRQHVARGRIFLGICLGMHLLFESSRESASATGLGILKGAVNAFRAERGLKVPHMGWNQIHFRRQECALFRNIANGSSVYFCHSYFPVPADAGCIAAQTDYGRLFASVIWQGNVYAMQFHPEKSQAVGLAIMDNFVRL